MSRFVIGFSVLVLGLAACGGDDPPPTSECADGAAECVVPWDCAQGQTCDATSGCCVEFGCVPGQCGAGTFCDGDTKECTSVGDACLTAPNGCECHILNPAGEFEATGDPTITLPAGANFEVKAVLAIVGGSPLPGATFSFAADDGTLFATSSNTLTASADLNGGSATLTATAGTYATCTADLVHLGAPAAGDVRFYVFDDRTSAPLVDAEVVIDSGTNSASTNANGIATITMSPGGAFNVSVFKTNFNYLSVVGVPAGTSDIALPMSARPVDKTISGFTGKADFEDYERRVLGGKPKTIKFGIVSTSFQLSSLLNFDLDLLIGPIASPDGGCDQVDNNGNHPAGCYEVGIPGLVDPPIWTALPGGILLSLASNPIKSYFDVVGAPGRRYAWSLGGEVEVSDISGLINLVTGFLGTCDCNTTDQCDMDGSVECACDSDCGLKIDFGGLFNSLTPLFSMFASGVDGNLAMREVLYSAWESYIEVPYSDRVDSAGNFPLLDSAGRGKLAIREPLQTFTDYAIGNLPDDPLSDYDMEGAVVLTGVNTTGFGFVPLGLGAGLDCTTSDCLDRDGAGADDYDGVVDGGLMCFYDPDPELNGCPPGVPTAELPDGHLGLFHAKAHGGLQGQEFLTIALALPITALADDSQGIRVAAKIARGEPATGDSNALAGAYPAFPTRPATQPRDTFTVNGNGDTDVHWVTIATEEDLSGMTTRWNIYYPGTGGTFTAPDPTLFGVTVDPFDPATGSGTDVINATHVSFKAPGVSLSDLAANNGTNLNDLLDDVDGFTVTSEDVTVTP